MPIENVRHLFEITPDITYLNCANMAPHLKSQAGPRRERPAAASFRAMEGWAQRSRTDHRDVTCPREARGPVLGLVKFRDGWPGSSQALRAQH